MSGTKKSLHRWGEHPFLGSVQSEHSSTFWEIPIALTQQPLLLQRARLILQRA